MVIYFDEIDVVLEGVLGDLIWVIDLWIAVNGFVEILFVVCVFPFVWVTSVFEIVQILENGPFNNLLFFMFASDHAFLDQLEKIFSLVIRKLPK